MSNERVHYLDWLKVVIVYGIVVFHVSLVFAYGGWLVANHDQSLVLSAFAGFCFPWGIPAMFLVAGADAWFSLRSRPLQDFVRKRFLRLLVPMVAGVVILTPLQRFLVSSNPPPSIDRLPAFYVDFFQHIQLDWTLQIVSRYGLHLWFLGYLFAISVVCAPAIAWLRTAAGRRLTSWILAVARRPAGLLVLAAPLALSQLVLRSRFSDYQDWADVATYTLAFFWGAVIFSDRRFELVIRAQIRSLVAGGIGATAGMGVLFLITRQPAAIPGPTLAEQVAQAAVWGVFVWSWLNAVVYLGMRWLNFAHPAIDYAKESVLPVYVIHHPFVLAVASFVVTWDLAVWPKFAIILVIVFALTLGTYELGVRRWAATRFVFGMSPRPKRIDQAPPAGSLRLSTG
ncbi:MAG TPA: acyltransferase family protein [Candidatus Dormibacteraeota bacterium]|nr:acyltransferase family protein [Candidatus Dormibacteraeota bacterium]